MTTQELCIYHDQKGYHFRPPSPIEGLFSIRVLVPEGTELLKVKGIRSELAFVPSRMTAGLRFATDAAGLVEWARQRAKGCRVFDDSSRSPNARRLP